ncbi:hypothetical protein TRFO_26983 [Tritrichomonas foetus]|uniref:Uncharacterized protein n=1 Tax=Tritrichomonas foetus TaxID=1144522 RepID=A0A1J4K229_9EUKA|nr:hypothetical protein TRFO_26983 [Tritrichomonas foetus]|eukprot:OHT05291.1 hypothetical protein TRFO_26983 [Tritrichomonas foetus]
MFLFSVFCFVYHYNRKFKTYSKTNDPHCTGRHKHKGHFSTFHYQKKRRDDKNIFAALAVTSALKKKSSKDSAKSAQSQQMMQDMLQKSIDRTMSMSKKTMTHLADQIKRLNPIAPKPPDIVMVKLGLKKPVIRKVSPCDEYSKEEAKMMKFRQSPIFYQDDADKKIGTTSNSRINKNSHIRRNRNHKFHSFH